MSVLLKGAVKSLLIASFKNKAMHYRYLSSMLTELPVKQVESTTGPAVQDMIMAKLRSAMSAGEVLTVTEAHPLNVTNQNLVLALRCLFELHKANKFELHELKKDPSFSKLCQNLKKQARALENNEIVEATKYLMYLQVPADTLIMQTMLQLVRCKINELNIRQIMFLDFLLRKLDTKNHLVDALKLALPLAFQIHLPMELDHDDLPLLRDMLMFSCSHHLPDRCINNIVTGLLLHDQNIDVQAAKSIVWCLAQINCTEESFPTRAQLLHMCYGIMVGNINQLTYEDVLRTAARLKARILEKHPEYYHEQLMDAIANYVAEKQVEFEKGLLVARILSRIAHTHLGLMEYLCQLAASDPDTLSNCRTNILFSFINCLSNNNYKPAPAIWTELKKQISENPILEAKSTSLPWTKVCLELASLGFYEDKIIQRVFSQEFLHDFLSRGDNNLDYIQLLLLQEAVNAFHENKYQLPTDILDKARSLYPSHHALTNTLADELARALGGSEYVARNVVLPFGIVVDILISLKGGYPMKLPELNTRGRIPFEDLKIPEENIKVCLMNFNQGCYSMNSNRLRGAFRLTLDILEHRGYVAVPVHLTEWLFAPAHEKAPYLIREIGYKCGELGMKLSVT